MAGARAQKENRGDHNNSDTGNKKRQSCFRSLRFRSIAHDRSMPLICTEQNGEFVMEE